MGFLDKWATGGGVVLLGALAKGMYRDAQEAKREAQETQRRKNSPLHFGDGLTQREFIELARDIAQRTPRVQDAVVTGMTVTLRVGSISGLSSWQAEIDFNDYGHLTGAYWLNAENSDSLVPDHFANVAKTEIERRVSRNAPGWQKVGRSGNARSVPAMRIPQPQAGWYPDPFTRYERRYWDGGKWTQHVVSRGRQVVDPGVAGA